MGNKWTRLVLAAAVLGLGGCASMSADECATSNWSAVGYEDGSRGYTTERFGAHRKACAKHGVTADFQAYQQGREQGLVEFCQRVPRGTRGPRASTLPSWSRARARHSFRNRVIALTRDAVR